jgi:hypothetical protein
MLDGQRRCTDIPRAATSGFGLPPKQISTLKERHMSRFVTALSAAAVTAILAIGSALASAPAAAADDAATKQAAAACKAQVKEQAKFQEMSWYARNKAVKKCVADTLAGH